MLNQGTTSKESLNFDKKMKSLATILILLMMRSLIIYDFSTNSNLNDWIIIDDVVMGGVSDGNFSINDEGNGVFSGYVSLENNGGFSSVRHYCNIKTSKDGIVVLHLKGDGKSYQFRVKDKRNQYYSYITTFKTSGEWETIEIELKNLYPSFRGRRLNLTKFEANTIEEIAFLIANNKNESFVLELDKIELK